MKTVVLHVPHAHSLESAIHLFSEMGWRCLVPDKKTYKKLESMGCARMIPEHKSKRILPFSVKIEEASLDDIKKADLFADCKAHMNYRKIVKHLPEMKNKICYYNINGGEPNIAKGQDKINLPCPIITPNQTYRRPGPWSKHAYVFVPYFVKFKDYFETYKRPVRANEKYEPPLCLVNNLQGWGYRDLIKPVKNLGVALYGGGNPKGFLHPRLVAPKLSRALAYVHLKASDAPGYSMWEAIASKCPLILDSLITDRNDMHYLFQHEKTCLFFDRGRPKQSPDKRSPDAVEIATKSINKCLHRLSKDKEFAEEMTDNAYTLLQEKMWNKERDGELFQQFLDKFFS